MIGPLRKLTPCALVALALVASGCAEHGPRTVAETEGVYLDIGGLKYQVQFSRNLNPSDPEDGPYVRGVPASETPAADETWFGIFVRVQNTTQDQTFPTASEFEVVDTQENVYEPVEIDPAINSWIYEPTTLGPQELVPAIDSAQFNGPTKGALLLFKVTYQSLQNRPLELEIQSPTDDVVGIVNLDV